MSDAQAMHVHEDRLVRFADGELGREADAVRRHVHLCGECRARLESIGRAGELYLEFQRGILKAQDPAPPRPWENLRPHFERIDRAHPGPRWKAWGAAAAAVAVAAGAYYWFTRPVTVSAAELLRKALASEPAANRSRRIRIRTSRHNVVRSAVLATAASPEEKDLEAMFLAAHFSWTDPLSARSFSTWRDQLPQKTDRVRQVPEDYEIRTTTPAGTLREATLVLDAHDLHPVRETLQFDRERVEIAQAEPEPAAGTSPVRRTPAAAPSLPAAALPATAAQELKVLAALHSIGADLGEPVQVIRQDGSLRVETTGLTAAREQQVRDAIAPIPGVTLEVDPADASPGAAPPARAATAAGSRGPIEAALGEEAVNRILDASEAVMARAFALRGLSRRFPLSQEVQLADADRTVLASLRGEYISGIRIQLNTLESSLAPLVPKQPAAPARTAAPWQARAGRIFTNARQVDMLLNRILAGGEEFGKRAPELAQALQQLDSDLQAEPQP